MSAYNFQKQFVPKIASGEKCSTIRMRRKNGYLPKVGDRIKLYQGMRTRACKLIREAYVTKVTPIAIEILREGLDDRVSVTLGADHLSAAQVHKLAVSDGFADTQEFADFFKYKYGDQVNAHLIEWRP